MPEFGLTARQKAVKRGFDLTVATFGFIATLPLVIAAIVVATVDTREFGLFSQLRIGRDGRPFRVYKIRTMRTPRDAAAATVVTVSGDSRITSSGRILRKLKIDELPQLANVIRGDMSVVGPRPDVEGFADELVGADRIILSVRPGITGPATTAYRHEEELLTSSEDPVAHNREVIWPEKVRINRDYVENYSFASDLRCLLETITSVFSTSS